jgi:rod shape-determining protein MreD
MRGFALVMLGYVLMGALGSLTQQIGATHFVPDVTIPLVVYIALNLRFLPGAIAVFALGLLADAFMGGGIIGLRTEVLLIVFLAVGVLVKRYRVNSMVFVALLCLAGIFVQDLLFLLLSVIFDARFMGASLVVGALFPRMLISLPFIPVVLGLARRIDRRFFRLDSRIFFG